MKKFRMSGGWWLVITSAIYLIAAIYDLLIYHENNHLVPIQLVWITIMSLPLFATPLARFCNMRTLWER